jgi:predicted peptidase
MRFGTANRLILNRIITVKLTAGLFRRISARIDRMTACTGLILALTAFILVGAVPARGEGRTTGFIHRVHKAADGTEARYVVFVPHDYRGDRPTPTIFFLHGAGEWGTDGEKQIEVGLGPAIRKREKTFPFLVVFPQSHKNTSPIDPRDRNQLRDLLATWTDRDAEGQRALAILAEVAKDFRVDPDRIYLTGLSMGGFGTWSLAASHPGRWAAIAPICGGGDAATAPSIKELPCWCFHGDADEAVPVARSREMVKALWAAGGHPNYTEYPGVGHNSWVKAYDTPDLYEWFLKHKLKKGP